MLQEVHTIPLPLAWPSESQDPLKEMEHSIVCFFFGK